MFYKLSIISTLILLCSCSINKSAISDNHNKNDSCSEFRNQISYNIENFNEAQSKRNEVSSDFYFNNINHLWHICPDKVTEYGENDSLIAQVRTIFKHKEDLRTEVYKQEAKVKAERELDYKICREKYLKRVEKVQNVTDGLNSNLKIVNNTGFKLPSQNITVSTDMQLATDVCPDENSNLMYFLIFSRKNQPTESNIITYNISLNVDGSTTMFKDNLPVGYDYKKYITKAPIVSANLNSIDYTLGMLPYSNYDKYLKLSYDENGINITNESNKFITISEIWFYFNGNISKSYVKDLSLPPESFKKNMEIDITDEMKTNMIFKNITKSKALTTKLKIGFAVKYKLENSNIESTLYKVKSLTLADAIGL